MWRLLPKVPATLLLVVAAWWSYDELRDRARHDIVRVGLTSSAFPLRSGVQGAWDLSWPAWPESKGAPVLVALGVPVAYGDQRSPVEVVLRAEPRDAVTVAKARKIDDEGWFEVASIGDWDTVARLDPSKARRVEYWVRRAELADAREARLDISGETDSIVLEGILVGGAVRGIFALLVGVPLVLWLVGGFVGRWIERRRAGG